MIKKDFSRSQDPFGSCLWRDERSELEPDWCVATLLISNSLAFWAIVGLVHRPILPLETLRLQCEEHRGDVLKVFLKHTCPFSCLLLTVIFIVSLSNVFFFSQHRIEANAFNINSKKTKMQTNVVKTIFNNDFGLQLRAVGKKAFHSNLGNSSVKFFQRKRIVYRSPSF